MKVLIVDDSRAMRMIVKRTLGKTDVGSCDVTEAVNGAEALELATSEHFDLVLCDWNMPEMPGIEFLKKLRASGCEVTFGFITSESGQDARSLAMGSGAHFILTKPFTAESLNAVLTECLN